MKFVNREMRIDQIIGYFNSRKIDLIPPFQRGSVWKVRDRQKLVQNMVNGRPIPAIFLYKNASGSQTNYSILDGKQRLESLILFVGNRRADMQVDNVDHYFYGKPARHDLNFSISVDETDKTFMDLDDGLVRQFKDYPISTIEIDMDDEEASFDEIVRLFVDINQSGVKVTRFDVVKAVGKDPLFKQVLGLVGGRQTKKASSYLKIKPGDYSAVLKNLDAISRLPDQNSQVNRMWERMTEIALFSRTHKHRAPADILKAFIKKSSNKKLTETELNKLRTVFSFLGDTYRHHHELSESKLAKDQPQFYTLVTTLLSTNLLDRYERQELESRILASARLLDGTVRIPSELKRAIGDYQAAAQKQTTHPARREKRQQVLMRLIDSVNV